MLEPSELLGVGDGVSDGVDEGVLGHASLGIARVKYMAGLQQLAHQHSGELRSWRGGDGHRNISRHIKGMLKGWIWRAS